MKMNRLTIFTLLVCVACTSPRQRTPIITTRALPPLDTAKKAPASLRSAERIVAYPLSRYIEPNHPGILHEAHTVYRVESLPHWNLRPAYTGNTGNTGRSSLPSRSPHDTTKDAQTSVAPSNAEWVVEAQRQKAATAELLKLNQTLETRHGQLSAGITRSTQDAERRAALEQELQSAQERLTRLESALKAETPDNLPKSAHGAATRNPQKPTGWDW